ncbi:MAG: hypothetical protein HQL45_00340 [Alphaproteobacteria bacterium]|nr:hypothetical protein [Alphaproteobacteria bacterium]
MFDYLNRAMLWIDSYTNRPAVVGRIAFLVLLFACLFLGMWQGDRLDPTIRAYTRFDTQGQLEWGLTMGPEGYNKFLTVSKASDMHIAWIGGSTIMIDETSDTPLPFLVKKELNARAATSGSDKIVVYLLTGGRVYDWYASLLDAVAQRPRAIVVALSPVVLMQRYKISRWYRWQPDLTSLPAEAGDWLAFAALNSPSSVLFTNLFRRIPALNWRPFYDASTHMVESVKHGLRYKAKGQQSADEDFAQAEITPDKWKQREQKQRGIMDMLIDSRAETSLNEWLVRRMARIVCSSAIPTLITIDPMRPDARLEPVISAAVDNLEAIVASELTAQPCDNAVFRNFAWSDKLTGSDFRDLTHLQTPGKFPLALSDELQLLLSSRKVRSP